MTRCINVSYKTFLGPIKHGPGKSSVNTIDTPCNPLIYKPDGEVSMREKQIENQLVSQVKKIGGIAPKFVSPGFDGMPDRLVLIPDGHIAFVELKAPGKKPRPLQLARHRLLRSLGFRVYVIDGAEQIGGMLDEIHAS
jgi:hypothetical protein